MANSLITRCPKCSTAFRVNDEVLSMAKGKVRCGQCFHIFNASEAAKQHTPASTPTQQEKQPDSVNPTIHTETQALATTKPSSLDTIETDTEKRLAPAEEIVNPDWLHTLFDDEDLTPNNNSTPNNKDTRSTATVQRQDDPAPWELELAEVEEALKVTDRTLRDRTLRDTAQRDTTGYDKTHHHNTPTTGTIQPNISTTNRPPPPTKPAVAADSEPDYMVALHSLAQTAAEQTRPSDSKNQHSILEQLSAQQSLAPLMGEGENASQRTSGHPWLWFFASLLGLALLAGQVANHFFDEGSRSANFRSIYRTICTYSGCALPGFQDVTTIGIQHVRIQSHPNIPNSLLVNAIITNTSQFSQPMPKIALEFFDLNGAPVAARLFSPVDYLHKDFMDITYMPPNTPVHLVIPIQDPGARAVTHQLRAFPADTRSY